MKIGYPCINHQLGCKASSTFKLKNFSEQRLIETIQNNLACLLKIIEFNRANGLLFFRISSQIIPFASHPIFKFNWQQCFELDLKEIGRKIKQHGIRISMHPDQFILINAINPKIVERSIAELSWHAQFLDSLNLDSTAKIQIHVGGKYQDKSKSIKRFIDQYQRLEPTIRKRLVIENDDRLFTVEDCLAISKQTGIPIVFDYLHYRCLNTENFNTSFYTAFHTWKKADGLMMVDYSSQQPGSRKGKHADTLDDKDFRQFLINTWQYDFDIMLEIKDKEKSALRAVKIQETLFNKN